MSSRRVAGKVPTATYRVKYTADGSKGSPVCVTAIWYNIRHCELSSKCTARAKRRKRPLGWMRYRAASLVFQGLKNSVQQRNKISTFLNENVHQSINQLIQSIGFGGFSIGRTELRCVSRNVPRYNSKRSLKFINSTVAISKL